MAVGNRTAVRLRFSVNQGAAVCGGISERSRGYAFEEAHDRESGIGCASSGKAIFRHVAK